ncbi:MAG: N-acetylmuramoyl-L-alanine amidase [Acidobacteriota bacterium]|jgi:N-acetylmuramoyl-L-alanine amidase|nr:N-acetylmuramoyl-L-alanine amidase [Acidobacteriota bacterium]
MANVDRIKRQLLRDLVQQNVDLIEGRPSRVRPRRDVLRLALRLALRVAALALLSVALFGSSRLLSTLAEPRPAVAAARSPKRPAPRPLPARQSGVAPAAIPLSGGLTAPEPVDAAVFPLAVRKIVIDAGHGGGSSGTRTPQGVLEKDLTLDIAVRLQRLLEKQFQVVMTRESDENVSLEERGKLANQAGADIFVSIHLNWIENRRSRGVETYYLGPTDDPYLTRLAASENRDSGYSMADLRHLLDRIYAGVRQGKSRKLAEVVQGALFQSVGKLSPEVEDRGVKAAPFIVLLSTEMPAILAEVSSMSNEEEARLLTKPLYRQYIAEALAKGIRGYAVAVEGAPEVAVAGEKGNPIHE